MRKLLLIIFTVSIVLISCSKDDINKTNSYSFVDQNLQGKIGNTEWDFVAGNVSLNSWDDSYFFKLYAGELEEPCSGLWDGDYVMFSGAIEPGIYELNWNLSDSENAFTVTLLEDADIPMNNIATEGAVEIISVDLEAGILTGRMDVRSDDETFVNGNFTLSICE